MSRYRLEISQVVRDALIHFPPQFKRKVKTALQSLSEDTYQAHELKRRTQRSPKLSGLPNLDLSSV